jgi:hypothetical protein
MGLNQTMCHYVYTYDNDSDDFVKYTVMTHGAVPRSNYQVESVLFTTRLSVESAVAIRIREADDPDVNRRSIQPHLDTLTYLTSLFRCVHITRAHAGVRQACARRETRLAFICARKSSSTLLQLLARFRRVRIHIFTRSVYRL